ncbi:MAG: hypothetical protein ACP5M9_01075 [Candidatus Micrarchaeia archaeon]
MMFTFISLFTATATTTTCNLGNINANNWIFINAMVILAMFSIGALIYAISNLMPAKSAQKLKGEVIYELSEGIISLLIFLSLISLVYASCSVGSAISGQANYQNLFQADEYYVGNLLFVKGPALIAELSFQGIMVSIDGNIVTFLINQVTDSLNTALGNKGSLFSTGSPASSSSSGASTSGSGAAQISTGSSISPNVGFGVQLTSSADVDGLFDTYAGTYATYGVIILVTFGLLFILYFLFPIVSILSFALVVPVALILRSFAFLGPSIRGIANTLLALAIAFYIVFPLTVSMNSYIINWMYCTNGVTVCNPYIAYTGNYKIAKVPISYLLKQNSVNFLNYGGFSLSLPVDFYGILTTTSGGVGAAVTNLFEGIVNTPVQLENFSGLVAEYFFEGVLLVAIDLMITLAFAQGLNKALNQIPSLIK